MMPARIAVTPPEEQIKEIVGSGPFKFARDEWRPGEQVVYLRNPDYIPRDETPSGSTGGKAVYLDKVIWRYIPDPMDAADALATGQVHWWEDPPLDFIPKLNKTRIYRHSSSIPSERKAGSGRTSSIRRSTTRRRARHSST
jgi:peptide/nickel transport system substrate-binding protein